ncbi:MAG TPA: adenylyltransferase/cytidyltransferase family protein [Candidatus Acidoferrales bacterium]|nr:adenylyltransferase/cytidyltransferase family protein [Candidatus Acidoferrales bacterium]
MNTRSKIVSRGSLRERLAEHWQREQKVVLANGCFDLLHAGHVRYLEGARREGDVLVVALNSDASTQRLKGPGRPILSAEARAELVGALAIVDYVVIFDEPDVRALLRELHPSVHAKGTDYTLESVPERDEAARLGIRVAIVGDAKQHSTRDLLSRIREAHG